MARPNESVHKLWEMSPEEFNQWRRDNDVPELLQFFKRVLPHFEEWQSTHKIDDTVFLAPTQPSKLFLGTQILFLRSSTGPDEHGVEKTTAYFHERAHDPDADREQQLKYFGGIRYRTNWELPFIPYFRWLQAEKRIKAFRIPGDSDANAFVRDFSYGLKEAYDTIFSRASLFHSHRVLKLGGVAIHAMQFDERNLDFVDLDHLQVSGRGASRETRIAYSSCYRVTLKNYNKPFVTFVKSPLENPRFENCHLEGFEFIESGMGRAAFRNARLSRFVLRGSMMWQANFERCDLVNVTVIAPKRASVEGLADFYKRLRVAFQAQGDRGETSKFYYQERFQRMRGHAFPLIPRIKDLPGLAYGDTLYSLYQQWERKQMTGKQVVTLLRKNLWRILIMVVYPPFLLRILRQKVKLIPEVFDWLAWGFGERPARIFGWMIIVVASFAMWYYTGAHPDLHGDIVAALSCSASNFATVDCPHAGQVDAAAEATLGIILLGLMVAGFSNRTRY